MSNLLNSTYNVTSFVDTSVMDSPVDFLYYLDAGIGHYMMVGILLLIGVVLFFGMKNRINSETESLMYSGLICSFLGLLLFLARTTFGEPLLSFVKLSPFVIVTIIAIYLSFVNRRY